MTHLKDPPRLVDSMEANSALRTALTRAQSRRLSALEVEQLVQAVEFRLASGDGGVDLGNDPLRPMASRAPSPRLTRAATGGPRSLVVKIGAAVVAAGAVGALLWGLQGSAVPVGPMAEIYPPSASPSELPARSRSPVSLPGAQISMVALSGTGHTASASEVPVIRAAPGLPVGPKAEPDPSSAAQEYPILRAARQSLAANPARSLALTEQHRQKFPQGMLNQEREAIAIEALARLGRNSESRSRAQKLEDRYPDSPYRGRGIPSSGVVQGSKARFR